MKTGFLPAFADYSFDKVYNYHGMRQVCNIQAEPIAPILYDTDAVYGPLLYKQFNAELNMGWSRRGGSYSFIHDHPVGADFEGKIGQYYWFLREEFMVGRYGVAFRVSGIHPTSKIVDATIYLNPIWEDWQEDFSIIVRSGMPTYPHIPTVLEDYNKDHYFGNGGSVHSLDRHWGWIALNAIGISWINFSGITKFVLISSRDIDAIEPIYHQYVDFSTEPGDVRLVIQYREVFP